MTNFCNVGDIARVTFPDGNVQDFSDTPINISCKSKYEKCVSEGNFNGLVNVRMYASGVDRFGSPWNSGVRERLTYLPIKLEMDLILQSGGTFVGNFYLVSPGTDISRRNSCTSTRMLITFRNNLTLNTKWEIISVQKYSNSEFIPDEKELTVIGISGNTLFTGLFNSCNYSVECVQGCPPNTLDCGDCCLDCASTFNQISAIRSLLSRIK